MKTLPNLFNHHQLPFTNPRRFMKSRSRLVGIIAASLLLQNFIAFALSAHGEDDPLLTKVTIDQLEIRKADEDELGVLAAKIWTGYDLNKLWIKSELERVDGETEENELQLLYGRAVAPYWDFQVGVRRDFETEQSPAQNWAVFGFQGIAPYFFEVDTSLFIGESGQSALRLEAEYEFMLTQRWVLTPEIEANLYGQTDTVRQVGAGLSDVELGLRLRYEITRQLAPYIGYSWQHKFGKSGDFAEANGESDSHGEWVLGLSFWF
jgi:copper resistance protein B